jgi:hypothetical protein
MRITFVAQTGTAADLPIGAEVGDAGVAGVVGDGRDDVPELDVAVLGVPAQQRNASSSSSP